MNDPDRHAGVPPEIAPVFAEVEALVERFFADRTVVADEGRIEIHGERYVLVRGASLSIEFFTLVRSLFDADRQEDADSFCRNFLFDLAHALGRSDARRFHSLMELGDPVARMAAGPAHFAQAGWASVKLLPGGNPEPGPDWSSHYAHPRSFEADAWADSDQTPNFPVCIMNSGYSSGWVSESLGQRLVATELTCRALGHADCNFVMATPDNIAAVAQARRAQLDPGTTTAEIPSFFDRTRSAEELRRTGQDLQTRVDAGSEELRRTILALQEEQAARQRLETQLSQTLKLDTLGKLAGGIAHDFGNLMVVIANRADLMAMQTDKPEHRREHLEAIQTAAARAVDLTNQLRRMSRGRESAPEVLEFDRVVEDLVRLVGRGLGRAFRVHFTPSGQDLRVWMDRSQLEQVVLNLIINARDAMPSGGVVRLHSRLTPANPGRGWVHVAITDEGHGIPVELQSRVFEPSFTTKAPGKGTGLGLATVASIVERAGGNIELVSTPGEGSTFTVSLPWRDRAPAMPPGPGKVS